MSKGITCLLRSISKYGVNGGIGRCNKTFNTLSTKTGEVFQEVVSDYGKGLVTKSTVFPSKIINTLSNGQEISYVRDGIGRVFAQEGNTTQKLITDNNFWDKLLNNIFRGLK